MRTDSTEAQILDAITSACSRFRIEGGRGVDWVFDHMSGPERLAFDLFLVRTKDPLAYEAGTTEQRFRALVHRMVRNQ